MPPLGLSISIQVRALIAGHPKLASTVAATILAAGCASALLPDTYVTDGGEWRSVTLDDGSVAQLGPYTKIVVRYGKQERSIQQVKGEATYQVAKDATRPFFVECDGTTVRAVGTKFGLTCGAQGSNVTVAEGTVSVFRGLVRRDQAAAAEYVLATTAQRVLLDRWIPLASRPVDVDVALAWERRRIFFNNTPVEEAIGEFNRRHKRQIPIPHDPGKLDRRLFGEFALNDPDSFIQHLETTIPE